MTKRGVVVKAIAPGRSAAADRQDPAAIDALYGLEPVYEPGHDPRMRQLEQFVDVQCPHCWQAHQTNVDLTFARQSVIEDCQHCCHPMVLDIEVVAEGQRALVQARRLDEG